jgi:hypothetical protein
MVLINLPKAKKYSRNINRTLTSPSLLSNQPQKTIPYDSPLQYKNQEAVSCIAPCFSDLF